MIARSFAFIYGRNQPSLGLLGIIMTDENFYTVALDGASIEINIPGRKIIVDGDQTFNFRMAEMEWRLTVNRGLTAAYKKFGNAIWAKMTEPNTMSRSAVEESVSTDQVNESDDRLQW